MVRGLNAALPLSRYLSAPWLGLRTAAPILARGVPCTSHRCRIPVESHDRHPAMRQASAAARKQSARHVRHGNDFGRIQRFKPRARSSRPWLMNASNRFAEIPARIAAIVFLLPLLLAGRAHATDTNAAVPSRPRTATVATSFRIHDFMPDFWRFWTAARGRGITRQVRLWQELYVRRHQAVFDDLKQPCSDEFAPAGSSRNAIPSR